MKKIRLPIVDHLRAMTEAARAEAARSWFAGMGLPDVLTSQQSLCMWMKFEFDLSQADIAKVLGFSYQRASTHERNALKNLRKAVPE